MGSSRFPGKPLANILERPMLAWVLDACKGSQLASEVILATPDDEIFEWGKKSGYRVSRTAISHERATDRMAEVATQYPGEDQDIFVLVQGDEPTILPADIDTAITKLINTSDCVCVNLVSAIRLEEEKNNVNCVKAICNPESSDSIFWLSRLGVPYSQTADYDSDVIGYKQVCIIPFRRTNLTSFCNSAPSLYEKVEAIDMLRILEAGGRISCSEITTHTHPVDVPSDIGIVEKILKGRLNV
jgi:3-deoxy-manno-octulosonate cytidylyltransferase (CMP-KDO synthetase)